MFNKSIAPPIWKAPMPEPPIPMPQQVAPAIRLEELASVVEKPMLDAGAQLLAELPPLLLQAAHNPAGARALIFALLGDSGSNPEADRLRPLVESLDVHAKLPLV